LFRCSPLGELARFGHSVRLIPPQYVKPYVKRNKTDAADAEVICEAVVGPNMRYVPVKTLDQLAARSVRPDDRRDAIPRLDAADQTPAEYRQDAARGVWVNVWLAQR
jgi:transposase